MDFINALFANLQQLSWLGILVARIGVGLLFAISGYGKLFNEKKKKQMKQTMKKADVPMPKLNAVFVSWVELIFGIFLLIGFLTPLAAMLLAATMVVAIFTVKLQSIESDSLMAWLGEFLFLPEVLFLIILIWLFFAGGGLVSLDNAIL